MRERDPRRLLARRREARARVHIVDAPASETAPDGAVTSRQVADVTVPRAELDRIWNPEYLERLARMYWVFLTRISLGLLRVLYTPSSRAVVLIARPLKLLTFRAPQYEIEATRGVVTWPIDRGLLVARNGRGKGCLRISVERPAEETGPEIIVRVTSEVVDFHPLLAGNWLPEPLARIGRVLYGITQLRVHVIVTNAFLRSLARLELPPSVVGALRPPERSAHPLA
ncbi:MAG: hypothetical protein E6G00_09720 [Actinobacteria bacterium]|nr:MAG: hypothetical protein E6G00_09720 [Actinomycetota bacterium]